MPPLGPTTRPGTGREQIWTEQNGKCLETERGRRARRRAERWKKQMERGGVLAVEEEERRQGPWATMLY